MLDHVLTVFLIRGRLASTDNDLSRGGKALVSLE